VALALELRVDALVVDDRKARRAAMGLGIQIIGTIGVRETGAGRGILNLDEALARIRATDFAVSTAILDAVRARRREGRR
jgi:predicted nucleic acid-binding protein